MGPNVPLRRLPSQVYAAGFEWLQAQVTLSIEGLTRTVGGPAGYLRPPTCVLNVRTTLFIKTRLLASLFVLAGFSLACAGASGSGEAMPEPASGTPNAEQPAGDPVGSEAPDHAGLFTSAQAERGADLFDSACGDCHASSEFYDDVFADTWGDRSAYSFYRNVSQTMPDDDPGGLEDQIYYDVVAYILEMNGHAPGSAELGVDTQPLRDAKVILPASDN